MMTRNETEIQLLKILFKNNGKATKNLVSKSAYPHGIEQKFFRRLKSIFKPLTDYVNKYLDENMNALLRGDSLTINLDAIPGRTFRNMIANLENWISIYMPDTKDSKSKNVIYMSLNETADEAKEFGEKEFEKMLKKGINVELPLSSDWWNDMKTSWAEDNYTLITSNAKNFVSKINTLTEQAIVNGLSSKQLTDDIKKATEGLSEKHCRLLARDQIGKLNGQITQAQMQEIGLNMYVWDTSGDERVRPSHVLMGGLLCRWDNASLCSYDNGKTWEKRPSGAVELHPGQDIQCRCIALSYYPELVSEIENVPMNEMTSDLPIPQKNKNGLSGEEEKIYKQVKNDISSMLYYEFNDNDKNLIYEAFATQDFSRLPKSFFEKKDGFFVKYGKEILPRYYPEKSERNLIAMQNQIDLIGLSKNKIKFSISEKKLNEIELIYEKNLMNREVRNDLLNKYSCEELLSFASKNLNNSFVADSNYLALSKYFNLNSDDGIFNIVRKGINRNSLMYYTSNIQDVKNISNAFKKTGFKYNDIELRTLAKTIQTIIPDSGIPWGTASESNSSAYAIALWDTKYRPFNKKTQILDKAITPNISMETLEKSISNKKYADDLMKNENALKPGKVSWYGNSYDYFKNKEFLRMNFDWPGRKISEYKVGDILEQSGVFATTPSELHNSLWLASKIQQGATNPTRFHLPRSKKTDELASLIINDDLGTGTGTKLNPEEIDFSISRLKVIKIEDGEIPAIIDGKKVKIPVKEVWVDIID